MAGSRSQTLVLVQLLVAATAFPVYDVTTGEDLATNPGRGTSFTSAGSLDASRAIQCYADYANSGAGTCNILQVEGSKTTKLSTFVFNENETHEIAVAPFSPSRAVVCYSDKGSSKHLICRALVVSGSAISAGEAYTVNGEAEEVPFIALTSLSESMGVLCWSYVLYASQDRAGVCNAVALEGTEITIGNNTFFDVTHSTSDISVKAFSDSLAVLCYSAQGTGTCATLSLTDDSLSYGAKEVFYTKTSEFFESLVVVSFTQGQGAVCYADGTDENFLACKVLLIDGLVLLVGAEAEIVNEHPTSWVTAAAITDSAALVCYGTEVGGNVNGEEFRGAGTCNVLGVIDNTTVGAGPPNEVNSNPTEHMSLASFDAASAMLCYSDFGAGAGHCLSLSMAPTTTTTTITTSTSTTSTTTATTSTETSSTTPHTTTASSTTTETSSTTPHTTTVTETPNRSPIVDSGSAPLSVLGAGAVLVLALARELVQ